MKIISYSEPEVRGDMCYETMDINVDRGDNHFHYGAIQVHGPMIEPVRALLDMMGIPCA